MFFDILTMKLQFVGKDKKIIKLIYHLPEEVLLFFEEMPGYLGPVFLAEIPGYLGPDVVLSFDEAFFIPGYENLEFPEPELAPFPEEVE